MSMNLLAEPIHKNYIAYSVFELRLFAFYRLNPFGKPWLVATEYMGDTIFALRH